MNKQQKNELVVVNALEAMTMFMDEGSNGYIFTWHHAPTAIVDAAECIRIQADSASWGFDTTPQVEVESPSPDKPS